ncbi:MAG: hypothetical protein ILNGONEN_00152 [Syntrophorhabdaceae bacterium]|nr:hypothetical protein [Syntrophorhabdaceae bacterium]
MRVAMLTQFHHDPTPAHFVGYCASRAGTGEGIKYNVPRISSDFDNILDKSLRFWCIERDNIWEERLHFPLRLLRVANFCMRPPTFGYETGLNFI